MPNSTENYSQHDSINMLTVGMQDVPNESTVS